MEVARTSVSASPSMTLPTSVLMPTRNINSSCNLKPLSRAKKIIISLALSLAESNLLGSRNSAFRYLQPIINSSTHTVKRLVKSVSKNALKVVSAISPRRHAATSPSISLPKSSFQEEAMVTELSAVFRHFDADGDGKISWAEVKNALNSVGEEASENELREMMKELDSDGDGCIDLSEFIGLINMEERGAEEEEKELLAAFRMFEREGRAGGGITPLGLHRMMSRLGENCVSLQHCTFIISQVDLDGDGVVNFNEFKQMMTAPLLNHLI